MAAPAFGVLLGVAYDGGPFSGFARQPEARTVAGELDGAVRAIDPSGSLVRGVSRTDAGVHARAQCVAFDTALDIPPRGWALALARHLPDEIAVVRAARVAVGYDPRSHARTKTYRYSLLESVVRDPFRSRFTWRITERLNQQAMEGEAAALVGEHDFRAFRAAGDPRVDTRRHILSAHVRPADGGLDIVVTGNRFLYKMVRIIAGTLVDVGRSRLPPGTVSRALASGARDDLGMTAPPEGLCLEKVTLGEAGDSAWPDQFPRD
ncbi:MAG: tRNA pseudouridine(38-40) synthase TruA [Myxococcales bacterium]|nr:tRNA pseudouridine(38-40) synthase TruA [Myxococcales bacterium]